MNDNTAPTTGRTLCRCGHFLFCCADCRDWLVEHSPRIADGWSVYLQAWSGGHTEAFDRIMERWRIAPDLAEANDLGIYLSRRFLA